MLIRSISGVRGLTATDLTPETVKVYAQAVHQLLPSGVIILGQDSRPSGEDLIEALITEFISIGRDVILCGIVPTPTIQFIVQTTDAVGGIIVTASHNPIEWNGLKFVQADGTFFHPAECERLFALADEELTVEEVAEAGILGYDNNALQKHVIHNVSLKCIDLNSIQRRHFKVVIDAVNGAGAEALPMMLDSLGCEVIPLYCEPTGEFLRGTEPLPHNLNDLCNAVKENHADVGFAVDPDADRLAIVSEKGIPLGEEYTLVLAAEGYLLRTKRKETFVTNLSTSLALDKLSEKYGCRVERAAVGEINVVQKMVELNANLGGEGNGGVILKEAHLGRDSLVAVTMVLNRMVQSELPLSEIHADLPQFHIIKDKIDLADKNVDQLLNKARSVFYDARLIAIDGLKFVWDDRWIHFRKSNTEPIMRIYAEAPAEDQARELIDSIKSVI